MKTEYRKVSNGTWEFLEYAEIRKVFWLFKKKIWKRVPCPYYNTTVGRKNMEVYTHVNSLRDDLDNFITSWPNIEDYWPIFNEEQDFIERKLTKKIKEYNIF
jgi:hypothetical protein